MSASYPTEFRRTALVPALLAVVALLVGVAIIDSDGFTVVRYLVSILALIVSWFAWQAKQWWWLVVLVPIAVLWNPVFPIEVGQPELWLGLQYLAGVVFLAAGILTRVPDTTKRG